LVDEILADDTTGGGRAAAHTSRLETSLKAAEAKDEDGDGGGGSGGSKSRTSAMMSADGVPMARTHSFLGTEKVKRARDVDV
jgi:hypothetical protein